MEVFRERKKRIKVFVNINYICKRLQERCLQIIKSVIETNRCYQILAKFDLGTTEVATTLTSGYMSQQDNYNHTDVSTVAYLFRGNARSLIADKLKHSSHVLVCLKFKVLIEDKKISSIYEYFMNFLFIKNLYGI